MSTKTYNFKDHKKGDTFAGVQFTVIVNGVAKDLTTATLKMEMRASSKDGDLAATFTEASGGGLTLTDAANGVFKFDEQVVDLPALTYFYDIEITIPGAASVDPDEVKSYIEGTWVILQDVTQ